MKRGVLLRVPLLHVNPQVRLKSCARTLVRTYTGVGSTRKCFMKQRRDQGRVDASRKGHQVRPRARALL